ncbi:hypothetical protein [Salinilacihabitans rarus]|uniref:hypothetical protein n=1 Tax=Salinilacihabitans rarus TaxID=2961596 RepID=UPI0020C8CFB8|nr:hypothetical protein [Salinilacihabitans rarus]
MTSRDSSPTAMQRTTSTLVALIVVVAFAGAVPFATAAQDSADSTADEVRPGEKLSGVVGVQEAEFEGELAERANGIEMAKAETDEAKADVAAEQLAEIEQRIADLDQRLQEAEQARESGEISEGQYRAEMAKVAAEKKTAQRLAEQNEAAVGELPADLLEEKGINVTAIQRLKTEASELGGEEVATIAQSIAGDRVGERMAGDADGEAYRPDPASMGGNGTDRNGQAGVDFGDTETGFETADRQIQNASAQIAQAEKQVSEDDAEAMAALERAKANLTEAEEALEQARTARENGENARENVRNALHHSSAALEHAEAALAALDGEYGADRTGSGATDTDS